LLATPFIAPAKYSIFEIADWFLMKESMTPDKLQKLCYYAQTWFCALKNIRLTDTDFEAWTCGPVSPALYNKFKHFGHSAIRPTGNYLTRIYTEDEKLLEGVWATYGNRTENALTALSQTEMSWVEARFGYKSDEQCTVVISPRSMEKYFSSILLNTNEETYLLRKDTNVDKTEGV
jgi:uncharacterized phage-associated protein